MYKSLKEAIDDNLIDYLPEWQRIFIHYPAYAKLCNALESSLLAPYETLEEKKSELIHARMIFDDLCSKDPEGEKEKERIGKENQVKIRNFQLDDLYEKQIKEIRFE